MRTVHIHLSRFWIGLRNAVFGLCLLAIPMSVHAQSGPIRSGPGAADLPQVLEVGHQAWLRATSLVCDFTVYSKDADTETAALSATVDKMNVDGRGFLVKEGTTVRLRYQPDGPVLIEKGEGFETRRNVPHDEVSNGWAAMDLEIPNKGTEFGFFAAIKKPSETSWPLQAGQSTGDILTPLYIAGRRFMTPYAFGDVAPAANTVQISVLSEEPTRVVVECKLTTPPWTQRRIVEYWTEVNPPVIRRVEELATNSTSNHWIKSQTEGSDFASTKGGVIAKTVRYVTGQKGRASWKTRVWQSVDLGDRLPTRDDFTIQIPDKCRVVGFAPSFELGNPRQVNIQDLKPTDLETKQSSKTDRTDPKGSATKGTLYWMLGTNLGIVLVLIAVVYYMRSRRAKSQRVTA